MKEHSAVLSRIIFPWHKCIYLWGRLNYNYSRHTFMYIWLLIVSQMIRNSALQCFKLKKKTRNFIFTSRILYYLLFFFLLYFIGLKMNATFEWSSTLPISQDHHLENHVIFIYKQNRFAIKIVPKATKVRKRKRERDGERERKSKGGREGERKPKEICLHEKPHICLYRNNE